MSEISLKEYLKMGYFMTLVKIPLVISGISQKNNDISTEVDQ